MGSTAAIVSFKHNRFPSGFGCRKATFQTKTEHIRTFAPEAGDCLWFGNHETAGLADRAVKPFPHHHHPHDEDAGGLDGALGILAYDWERDLPLLRQKYATNRKVADPEIIEEFIEKTPLRRCHAASRAGLSHSAPQ
jgi:hypothetical protein